MKAKMKALTLALCAVLLVATTVFVTVAYLTSTTETVTNTFTVGKVIITLDEADVNPDGSYVTDKNKRVTENEYHLLPGHKYIKDPTVHIDSESEPCYLFVKVENGLVNAEESEDKTDADTTIAEQMKNLGWTLVEGQSNIYVFNKENTGKYILYAGADVVVFNDFIINSSFEADDIDDYTSAEIKITAYAIQADGFENSSAADIWKAFSDQNTPAANG